MKSYLSIKEYPRLIILIGLIVLFNSCDLLFPEDEPEKTANEYIYETFREWYLWYDQIPEIDPNGIESQEALIDSIRYPLDRWSSSVSASQLNKLYQSGKYTGFGAGFIIDSDNNIRISHVYKESPFGKAGIGRAWKVISVNGYTSDNIDSINSVLSSGINVNFVFSDTENSTHTLTLSREEVTINSVLYSNVFEINKKKIGYLVFDRFYETSIEELNVVIEKFKNDNISELIIDLRYNGGGLNNVAYNFFSMIGGDTVAKKNIITLKNNDKHSEKDNTIIASYGGTVLNLPRLFFITTNKTASASELVINSLEPYLDVTLIGSNTNGKPVGMYIFTNEKLDLSVLPISFKFINNLGYGDYYNGLPVDINEIDDLTHDWGNIEEKMLQTALTAISDSIIADGHSELKSSLSLLQRSIGYKGIYQLIQAY